MQGQEDLCSYLKTHFEHKNRDQYLDVIRQTISTEATTEPADIDPLVEEYASQYRNFMHNFSFTANNKANALIEQALNNVHPGLKTKKECKVLLSIVAKIFCQELIEECVEVKEQLKKSEDVKSRNGHHENQNGEVPLYKRGKEQQSEIDVDVVEEALRRRLMKREGI